MNAIEMWPQGPPDPRVWAEPDMRAALAKRDFGRVYRLLQKIGYSQQRIAALTGQSQPEVSAIIHGRRLMALEVIERVVWGLTIPPAYVGLACLACRDTACAPAEPTADGGHAGLDREIMAAYARLQSNPDSWAGYLAELEEWAGPLGTPSDPPATITGSAPGPTAASQEREDGCES